MPNASLTRPPTPDRPGVGPVGHPVAMSVDAHPLLRHVPLARQFVKFGLVGVSNTLLTLVTYTVLVKVFGVWYLLASAIGFAVGATNGYLLNRAWTFRGHEGGRGTAARWVVVQGVGLLLNLGLVYLFVSRAGLDKLLGQVCATAIVTVVTFFVNRRWTFRAHVVAVAS